MKKLISVILSCSMLVALASCGQEPKKGTAISATPSSAINTTGAGEMGRWVETIITPKLGDNGLVNKFVILPDGTFECFTRTTTDVSMGIYTSTDAINWQEKALNYADKVGGNILNIVPSPSGKNLLIAARPFDAGLRNMASDTLWLAQNGQDPVQIKGDFPQAPQTIAFITDNEFVGEGPVFEGEKIKEFFCGVYNVEDGQKIADIDDVYSQQISMFNCSNGKLLYSVDINNNLITLDSSGNITSMPTNLGAKAVKLFADDSGNVYFITALGFYRIVSGGSIIETIFQSPGFAFSLAETYVREFSVAENGDVFVLADDGSKDEYSPQLYRYSFDKSLPAVQNSGLTIWSYDESPILRLAIADYATKHNGEIINYEPASSQYEQIDDAIKALNTELLSGAGPDVIIMDGIDYESYIDKGALMDISTIASKANLTENIKSAFVGEKTFALPTSFVLPIINGGANVQKLTDIDKFVQEILALPPRKDVAFGAQDYYTKLNDSEKYAFTFTSVDDITDYFLNTSYCSLFDKSEINTENTAKMLGYIKQIHDYYNIGAYAKNQEKNGLGATGNNGENAQILFSSDEYYNGRAAYGYDLMISLSYMSFFTSVYEEQYVLPAPGVGGENTFIPKDLVGINANSKNIDDASEIVSFMFTDEVQCAPSISALPVTVAGQAAALKRNENAKGNTNLAELLQKKCVPVLINKTVANAMKSAARDLCEGKIDVNAAINSLKQELSLFLAEKN